MYETVNKQKLLIKAQTHSNGNESRAKDRVGKKKKTRGNIMALEFQENGSHSPDARDRVGFQAEKNKKITRSKRVYV